MNAVISMDMAQLLRKKYDFANTTQTDRRNSPVFLKKYKINDRNDRYFSYY